MTPDAAQSFLDQNFAPWVLALGPRVVSVSATGAVLRIPLGQHIARVGGIASGQAMVTLADTAMVIACGAAIGDFVPVSTTNLDTQFLRPATGEAVRAEAEVVRAGKALIFARATLFAEPSGKPVGTASATFFRPG
jgi:uncharacterized protein (TIGR00369 family)